MDFTGLGAAPALPAAGSKPPATLLEFLDHFLANHREDNFLSVKHGNYTVAAGEVEGEAADWVMQYLQYM